MNRQIITWPKGEKKLTVADVKRLFAKLRANASASTIKKAA